MQFSKKSLVFSNIKSSTDLNVSLNVACSAVGCCEGRLEGFRTGEFDGVDENGKLVGSNVIGAELGVPLGKVVIGCFVGMYEGMIVGFADGPLLGALVLGETEGKDVVGSRVVRGSRVEGDMLGELLGT